VTPVITSGAGFLLAVLGFDLMFDVQMRGRSPGAAPEGAVASIAGYYRRVTTEAFPMNRLVAAVMLFTLLAIIAQIVEGRTAWWIGWGSLALSGSGIVPTLTRVVPNAVRLGSAVVPPEQQSVLARSIYRAHVFAFARMTAVLVLQLIAR
jgi:hypothetical protein